jgi:hypothetical protein
VALPPEKFGTSVLLSNPSCRSDNPMFDKGLSAPSLLTLKVAKLPEEFDRRSEETTNTALNIISNINKIKAQFNHTDILISYNIYGDFTN